LESSQHAVDTLPHVVLLSGESSGELAARSALQQRRRKSLHGGTPRPQRYGSFWQGDDRELEHTLHVRQAGAWLVAHRQQALPDHVEFASCFAAIIHPCMLCLINSPCSCLLAQEYNHDAAVVASPRMTRGQRRKSLAAGQRLQLQPEPAVQAGQTSQANGEQQQAGQRAKRQAATGKRKSLDGLLKQVVFADRWCSALCFCQVTTPCPGR
jgi:hypothetical protein